MLNLHNPIKKLSLMLPTYRRPQSLDRFITSAIETCDDTENIMFVLCVNHNDKDTLDTIEKINRALCNKGLNNLVETIIEHTRQPDLAYYFNLMFEQHPARFNPTVAVSMFGDDMVFTTKSWDTKFLDKMNATGGLGVYYGDDGYIAHDQMCVHFFTSREYVRGTGLPFMCPLFKADMIDVVWYETAKMTNSLYYIPDIVIFHDHATRKTVEEYDKTFQRLVPLQRSANDHENQTAGHVYAAQAAGNLVINGLKYAL